MFDYIIPFNERKNKWNIELLFYANVPLKNKNDGSSAEVFQENWYGQDIEQIIKLLTTTVFILISYMSR